MEYLNSLDTNLFLFLNGLHNPLLDPVMYWLSDKLVWIPMYLLIIWLIIKRYRTRGLIMLFFLILVIGLCDQTASGILKNLVQRLRPSHQPSLTGLIYVSSQGPGGLYGFASSHAANVFGLATFLYFVLGKQFKLLKYWLFTWAILVSYSRIYNGVHYPGDVIAGAMIGLCFGYLMAKIYFRTDRYLSARKQSQP